MITKAFISSIIDKNRVRVRIPLYNKLDGVNGATPNNELAIAPICTLPNIISSPSIGDIVFVGFEEENLAKPVILGYLSTTASNKSYTDIICNDLEVKGEATLGKETQIGDIKYKNLESLKGYEYSIKDKFTSVDKSLKSLSETTESISKNLKTTGTSVASLDKRIIDLETGSEQMKTTIQNISNSLTKELNVNEKNSLAYKLNELNTKLDKKIKIMTTLPTSEKLEEGQICLWVPQ